MSNKIIELSTKYIWKSYFTVGVFLFFISSIFTLVFADSNKLFNISEKGNTTPAIENVNWNKDSVIRIGVLANRGEDECFKRWAPTAGYLSRKLHPFKFVIVPLSFNEIYDAILYNRVEYVAANPAYYACLEFNGKAHRIATLQKKTNFGPSSSFGGVVFTKSTRKDINNINDLSGKKFSAVDSLSFGGWHAVLREMTREGINPEKDFAQLIFEKTHDAVVYAVLSGKSDAGTVRSSHLETMASEGLISMKDFKLIHSKNIENPLYPYWLSTPLYPEWAFAAVTGVDAELSKLISRELLSMPQNDSAAVSNFSAGWAIPQDYASVHELLRELRLPPYETYGEISFFEVIEKYWLVISLFLILLIVSLIFGMRVSFLNRNIIRISDNLLEKEEYLTATLRSIGDAVIVTDIYSNVISLNTVAEKLTGWATTIAKGLSIDEVFKIVEPKTGEKVQSPVFEVIKNERTIELNEHVSLHSKSGEVYQIADTCAPIFNKGKIIGTVLVFRDVSKEYRYKQQLKESEEKSRLLSEVTKEGILIHEKGITRDVNAAICRICGYSKEELVGENIVRQVVHPDFHELVINNISSEFYHPYEIKIIRKDGTELFVEIEAYTIEWQDKEIRIVAVRDIDEKKKVTEALRENELQFQKVIHNLPISLSIITLEGKLLYINPKGIELFELYLEPNVEKRNAIEVWANSTDRLAWIEELKKNGMVREFEMYLQSASGRKFWAIGSGIVIRYQNELCVLSTQIDITGRKIQEDAIKKQNEELHLINAEKDKFFSIIAHDLRSPFQGFIGLSKKMSEDYSSYSINELIRMNDSLHKSALNLYKLLENLLEWTIISRGKMEYKLERINVSAVINSSIEPYHQIANQKEIEIVKDCPFELFIYSDFNLVGTIIRNLVSNAVKFTNRGGRILITAKEKGFDKVEISVADTGIGIPDDIIPKLFKIDERVNKEGTEGEPGTGLGLVLCTELLKKQKSKITIESEVGKGSTFSFILPESE